MLALFGTGWAFCASGIAGNCSCQWRDLLWRESIGPSDILVGISCTVGKYHRMFGHYFLFSKVFYSYFTHVRSMFYNHLVLSRYFIKKEYAFLTCVCGYDWHLFRVLPSKHVSPPLWQIARVPWAKSRYLKGWLSPTRLRVITQCYYGPNLSIFYLA